MYFYNFRIERNLGMKCLGDFLIFKFDIFLFSDYIFFEVSWFYLVIFFCDKMNFVLKNKFIDL